MSKKIWKKYQAIRSNLIKLVTEKFSELQKSEREGL